jgi:biopolymer transport protein ExbB/TolQ
MNVLQEQRDWQRQCEEADRQWRADESRSADERHQEQLRLATEESRKSEERYREQLAFDRSKHRTDIIVAVGIISMIGLIGTVLGAFIERGSLFPPTPAAPPVPVQAPVR